MDQMRYGPANRSTVPARQGRDCTLETAVPRATVTTWTKCWVEPRLGTTYSRWNHHPLPLNVTGQPNGCRPPRKRRQFWIGLVTTSLLQPRSSMIFERDFSISNVDHNIAAPNCAEHPLVWDVNRSKYYLSGSSSCSRCPGFRWGWCSFVRRYCFWNERVLDGQCGGRLDWWVGKCW